MKPTDQLKTAAYYAQHAQEYFDRTNDLDLGAVYESFERRLKPGSRILDLGCGSGRDARHFAAAGHSVVALDPCRELLALATRHTPDELRNRIMFVVGAVPKLGFGNGHFDAIWACGSLLHLSKSELRLALTDCHRVLANEGQLFLGLKSQDAQFDHESRSTTLWSTGSLLSELENAHFRQLKTWVRPSMDGRDIEWLNVIAKRESKP